MRIFSSSIGVCFLLVMGVLSGATQAAPRPAPESRWEQLWEERVSIEGLSTATVCAAVYAGMKEQSEQIDRLIKDRKGRIDYTERQQALDHKMRSSIEVTAILDPAEREAFINKIKKNIIVQANNNDTTLGKLAGMCDSLFRYQPTPAFYQYSGGPIQTVPHDRCADRYSALVLGFAQSNRPFAEGMNQRAQYAMARHETVFSRFLGVENLQDSVRKELHETVMQIAKSEVVSAMGDDTAVHKLFIKARACDTQYGLLQVPIPGEVESR